MRGRGLALYSWAVYGFLYLPILVMAALSFNKSRYSSLWGGFTLDWYVRLLGNDMLWTATRNSLVIALLTALIASGLGTLMAVALHRHRPPGSGVAEAVVYLPMVLPDMVMGVGALVLFSALGVQLGLGTILAAHVGGTVSYVVVTLRARLEGIDRSLEEAAADLGANPWQAFRHVTLPLLGPGILAGALLVFTLSLDDFILAFFTAGPGATTLPLRVYGMVKVGISPEVNALSTVLLVVTAVAAAAFQRLTARRGGGPSAKSQRKGVPA